MAIFANPFPIYQPAMRIITDITNSNPAIVTTSFANQYKTGTIVRIIMPYDYGYYTWGMSQINNQQGAIEVIDNTHFAIDINTTFYDPLYNSGPGQLGYDQKPCSTHR
jgi:GTP:adenosylcobinamide-phosphate guanylyltransferase